MKKFLLLLLFLQCVQLAGAQAPYTQANQFPIRIEQNLVYGTAENYMGLLDTLRLNLYKPLGDGNAERPLLVAVHGGGWVDGCKDHIDWLAREMAGRGYVVAAVNYRLGWHKDDYVATALNAQCSAVRHMYPADSCEIIRGLYRAQQDVKAAIRWMRCRHEEDSTSLCNVLVGGESAGCFTSMAVGFLDRPVEKPACCFDLPDAPTPDPGLLNQTTFECKTNLYTVPPGSLARPDLGPVDGTLNQNGYDANVLGVMAFFGGVLYEASVNNWLQGPDTPAVYFYHQTCDGVVPFNYGQPFQTISGYCNLGCTPWHSLWPHVYGTGAIAAAFGAMANPPVFTTDFDACDPFNPDLALFECARYADNGSYHFTANQALHAQHAADFFSPLFHTQSCAGLGINCTTPASEPESLSGLRPMPNPFNDRLLLHCEQAVEGAVQYALYDLVGHQLVHGALQLHLGDNEVIRGWRLPAGVYVLKIEGQGEVKAWRVVCSRP